MQDTFYNDENQNKDRNYTCRTRNDKGIQGNRAKRGWVLMKYVGSKGYMYKGIENML